MAHNEWWYRFALPLAVVALAPNLLGLTLYSRQATRLSHAVTHLCALQTTTRIVWASAIVSYESLSDKTAGQKALLAALRRGVAEIQSDRSCPERH